MPEYFQIQTYVKCNNTKYPYLVNEFIELISLLGFSKERLLEEFSQIEWEVAEDGLAYVGGGPNDQFLNSNNMNLTVRPYIKGWTLDVIPGLSEVWLEISLLLHAEEIEEEYEQGLLKQPLQPIIWMLLTHISNHFSETGTFLTNEATDGVPWEALMKKSEGKWAFDAAFIPNHLCDEYSKIDEELFFYKKWEKGLFFARKAAWMEEPWFLPKGVTTKEINEQQHPG